MSVLEMRNARFYRNVQPACRCSPRALRSTTLASTSVLLFPTTMATFSRATFNAASYASYRPTYPKALYDIIFSYHSFGKNLDKASSVALDLGCGTGLFSYCMSAL